MNHTGFVIDVLPLILHAALVLFNTTPGCKHFGVCSSGTTDATGDGMSFDQAGEGGSNRELSALDGSGLLSNTPPGESLGTAVESKESKDVSTCAGASPRKKRKVTGKRTGLTVRFKSGWKKP